MPQITLEVTQEALDNFQKTVEEQTGFKVTDALALFEECIMVDIACELESYAYMVADGYRLHEGECKGLDKY